LLKMFSRSVDDAMLEAGVMRCLNRFLQISRYEREISNQKEVIMRYVKNLNKTHQACLMLATTGIALMAMKHNSCREAIAGALPMISVLFKSVMSGEITSMHAINNLCVLVECMCLPESNIPFFVHMGILEALFFLTNKEDEGIANPAATAIAMMLATSTSLSGLVLPIILSGNLPTLRNAKHKKLSAASGKVLAAVTPFLVPCLSYKENNVGFHCAIELTYPIHKIHLQKHLQPVVSALFTVIYAAHNDDPKQNANESKKDYAIDSSKAIVRVVTAYHNAEKRVSVLEGNMEMIKQTSVSMSKTLSMFSNVSLWKKTEVKTEEKDDIAELFQDEKFSDIIFTFESGDPVYAHKYIICDVDHFDDMFLGDKTTISSVREEKKLMDVNRDHFVKVKEFIYLKKTTFENANVALEVMILAEKFDMEDLGKYCEDYLVNEISKNNYLQFWQLANKYSAERLQEDCIKFCLLNEFANIVETNVQILWNVVASNNTPLIWHIKNYVSKLGQDVK